MPKRWPVLLLLPFLLFTMGGTTQAQDGPSLSVDPVSQTIEPGEGAFEVRILVDDLTTSLGLGGYALVVRYDPGVLHALSIADSGFVASAGNPTTCPDITIDNETGQLRQFCFTARTSAQPGPRTDEPEVLASITFEPSGEGLTLLDIGESMLIDPGGADLAIATVNGEVTVGFRSPAQPTSTPDVDSAASDGGQNLGLFIGLGIAGLAIAVAIAAAIALQRRSRPAKGPNA